MNLVPFFEVETVDCKLIMRVENLERWPPTFRITCRESELEIVGVRNASQMLRLVMIASENLIVCNGICPHAMPIKAHEVDNWLELLASCKSLKVFR